ncbi:unnamed protein product, partial [marine sediment metagenome]
MREKTSITRRSFLAAGAGTLTVLSQGGSVHAQPGVNQEVTGAIRVGIVGFGPYSHCVSYGRTILSIGERRPFKTHMHITHIWGDDYSKNFAGSIWSSGSAEKSLASRSPEYIARNSNAQIVRNPEDMIGEVDAAMIMDFDLSAQLAEPFLK